VAIEIRPIRTLEEYHAVERMQHEVWGLDALGTVPHHLLLTAQKNGGLLIGAFDPSGKTGGRLVGFVFGFVGLTVDGRVKHCSHMAGVHPDYQSQNLGYRIKLAQRERVLAQGIDLVTWTFEPLESRNANLNFRKLGAICRIYRRDMYGEMNNPLYAGLPSDRFEVEWPIAGERVARRVAGDWRGSSLSTLEGTGVPVVNRAPRRPAEGRRALEGDRLLVQIPSDFQGIKATDMALARAWRLHSRALFEAAFARGYAVTDLIFEAGRSYYLLEMLDRP
jgi:predicted GNAT superfamily acetyltransferase